MQPTTVMGINQLDPSEKRETYARIIPPELLQHLNIDPRMIDENGNELLSIKAPNGSHSVEVSLRHQVDFPDPVLFGHLTDTLNGQIHILLYILNDPSAPRFEVDRLPDGRPTVFGTKLRNLEAEEAAMDAGLAPGQIRRGLRMLSAAIAGFEKFTISLQHDLYFAEPLYYHNALIFEQYGFNYQKGKKRMEAIQAGFSPGGHLLQKLDGSTPFRAPEAANSIRLRSWAIHDGILGEPFTEVTMYKHVGTQAGINTCLGCSW
jgi:hypothetical protein